ncbi:13354_t:CDS:2, partial [Racocetra fulgida]
TQTRRNNQKVKAALKYTGDISDAFPESNDTFEACSLANSNQTDTLIQALNELIGSYKREKFLSLHGKALRMSKNSLFLVDTSVFIDFFRGAPSDAFKVLLSKNQIILSLTVKLEILRGTRKKDAHIVQDVLSGLRQLSAFPNATTCLSLLNKAKGTGLLGGIPDLLIMADA